MRENAKPKHEQLKAEIVRWIDEGAYKPNDRLPTEHELVERFELSRQTVRQAIGALVQEGRLYRIQGSGTYVAEPAMSVQDDMPMVGVITTYISDYIFPEIVRGAESAFRAAGYPMMLTSTDNDKEKERDNLLKWRKSGRIRGLVVEPTRSAQGNVNLDCFLALEQLQIPYIMINARYPELNCPCVIVDDELGGYLATRHLIKLGHRRIAGFFKTDDLQGVQRLRGFMRAHRESALPLRPDAVYQYTTEEKRDPAYRRALAYLQAQKEERPTAFVCYNDELAVWLLEAVRQAGLRVPDDLSIVGFDDSFLATATETKLTTVSHPKFELGVKAAELLIGMMRGEADDRFGDIVFPPELVIRNSTRKL